MIIVTRPDASIVATDVSLLEYVIVPARELVIVAEYVRLAGSYVLENVVVKLAPLVNVVVANATVRTDVNDAALYCVVAACDAVKVVVAEAPDLIIVTRPDASIVATDVSLLEYVIVPARELVIVAEYVRLAGSYVLENVVVKLAPLVNVVVANATVRTELIDASVY